tara:strand:- start:51330 stop:52757 length:1428 start_codon:yes stop_codon:yes gene_type:complete
MSQIAAVLKRFITSHKVDYRLYCHSRVTSLIDAARIHNIAENTVARSVVLKDAKGYMLAVLPLNTQIDCRQLNKTLRRELYIVKGREADRLFRDCEPFAHPPIAAPYGLSIIADIKLLENDFIYIEPGSHTSLLRFESSDFHYLMAHATWAKFAKPLENGTYCSNIYGQGDNVAHEQLDKQVNGMNPLPVLPKIAYDIVQLSKENINEPAKLLDLLNADASMAQVLQQYKNLQPNQRTGETAAQDNGLKHILNFDTISHVVLGAATHKRLEIVEGGVLGIKSFWQHAVLSAKLMYLIATEHKAELSLDPATCYLGGLLHNFGFLFISNLYQPEFKLLNRWLSVDQQSSDKTSVRVLERRLLGLGGAQKLLGRGHASIGAWLMSHWEMPQEVKLMAENHHNPHYTGIAQNYVVLLVLVNHVLRKNGIGEGDLLNSAHEQALLGSLGLAPRLIDTYLEKIICEKIFLPQDIVSKKAV